MTREHCPQHWGRRSCRDPHYQDLQKVFLAFESAIGAAARGGAGNHEFHRRSQIREPANRAPEASDEGKINPVLLSVAPDA